jgi:AhpC/TSA family protein
MCPKTHPGKTWQVQPGLATPFERPQRPSQGLSRRFVHNLMVLVVMFVFLGTCDRMEAGLKVGDMAPDFSLPGSDGKSYNLSDFRGKQVVVLAWFPKAFTGG